MNFIDISFWYYLVILTTSYGVLKKVCRLPSTIDKYYLLFVSYALFALASWLSFVLYLAITGLIFIALQWFLQSRWQAKYQLLFKTVVVTLSCLPLFYYKYRFFFTDKLTLIDGLVIPIGISFYTLQLLSLFFDIIKKHNSGEIVQLKWIDYANYSAFFPQIIAGPIERKDDLYPQLQNFQWRWSSQYMMQGCRFIVLGLCYKIALGEGFGYCFELLKGNTQHPLIIHLTNIVYSFRIYFDFCGYSLIAYGIAKLFGVKLTLNFLSPYTQRNIQQFWRCWHVSLSRWLKDYIYIALGGNRFFGALFITFFLSGVWHGASVNFLIWGAAHGCLVLVFRLLHKRLVLPAIVAWSINFMFVTTLWLFFYEESTANLWQKLELLMDFSAYKVTSLTQLVASLAPSMVQTAYIGFLLMIGLVVLLLEFWSRKYRNLPYSWGLSIGGQVVCIFVTILFFPEVMNRFIYFNF